MQVRPRQLVYFELSEGRYPFRDWLRSLTDAMVRRRLKARLRKLELGNPGHWRSVGAGVIELKEDFGPGFRLYVAEDGPVCVVLLAGGIKAGQAKDIQMARDYWHQYLTDKLGRQDA